MDLTETPFQNEPTNFERDGTPYHFEPIFLPPPTLELNMDAFHKVDIVRDINWLEQRLYEATAELKRITENQFATYKELVALSDRGIALEAEVQRFKDGINIDTHKNWIHLYRHVNETQRRIKEGYKIFTETVHACIKRKEKMLELKHEIAKLSSMVNLYDDHTDAEIASRFDFYEVALELKDERLEKMEPEKRIMTEAKLLEKLGCYDSDLPPHDHALMIYVLSLGVVEPQNPIYLD